MAINNRRRLEARVTGRVQGVGFRAFITRQAQHLDVEGWVRNERDGSVRLVAEGPREQLERLLASTRQGPSMAHVDHVTQDWDDATDEFDGFSVRH